MPLVAEGQARRARKRGRWPALMAGTVAVVLALAVIALLLTPLAFGDTTYQAFGTQIIAKNLDAHSPLDQIDADFYRQGVRLDWSKYASASTGSKSWCLAIRVGNLLCKVVGP